MFIIDLNGRIWKIQCRKSSHVRWCYSDYQGRWPSVAEAIIVAKRRYPKGEIIQYNCFNIETEEEVRGTFEATGEECEEQACGR